MNSKRISERGGEGGEEGKGGEKGEGGRREGERERRDTTATAMASMMTTEAMTAAFVLWSYLFLCSDSHPTS